MDTQIDNFKHHFDKASQSLNDWGVFVASEICNDLKHLIPESYDYFIKIPVIPRLKTWSSAVSKIKRKNYTNPIVEMTDLVGIRFVVLMTSDIEVIMNAIINNENFNSIQSKDYQAEIDNEPTMFDYQSVHFEVRPSNEYVKNHGVSENLCCEVQIRTLLQHAYAELVHSSIYKPEKTIAIPSSAKRKVAQSMALMEATDELFCSTKNILADENKAIEQYFQDLKKLYTDSVGLDISELDNKTNLYILAHFKESLSNLSVLTIEQLIKGKPYIVEKIKARNDYSFLFKQPVILFLYKLIESSHPNDAKKIYIHWLYPAYKSDLENIFVDLDVGYD